VTSATAVTVPGANRGSGRQVKGFYADVTPSADLVAKMSVKWGECFSILNIHLNVLAFGN
jgi:hypothetical protein